MFEWVLELIERHRQLGVVVDTNVLLLYFIGRFDPEEIGRFKRTNTFVIEDFRLLEWLLSQFGQLLTTPNILTEVSNLSGQFSGLRRSGYFEQLRTEVSLLREEYLGSRDVVTGDAFVRFGLTDASIHLLSKGGHLVLTGEVPLYTFLQSQGVDCINFNHLRPLAWR